MKRNKTGYFTANPEDPPSLTALAERVVRFEELDPLGIVWHGRYPGYLEDGRTAFGKKYGLSYLRMFEEGYLAPIVKMDIDYFKPLELDEEFTIETTLHWCRAARLNFSYKLSNSKKNIIATAFTVQIFINKEREPQVLFPPFVDSFFKTWKENNSPLC